ncbi:hypothetical protein SteCoe_10988 [Stentor coeruleus]|uniref:RING-type domain-containing protein n=1 Tax=Stentor coeruleus TaxID=5963 RepID=A0A1R2CE83_9CILI|nr:hypothetical protein SteCoe_10988 [Stentor coeruleus]
MSSSDDSSDEIPNIGKIPDDYSIYYSKNEITTSNAIKISENQKFIDPQSRSIPISTQQAKIQSVLPTGVSLNFPSNIKSQSHAIINPQSKNPLVEKSGFEVFNEESKDKPEPKDKSNRSQLPISKPIFSTQDPNVKISQIPPPSLKNDIKQNLILTSPPNLLEDINKPSYPSAETNKIKSKADDGLLSSNTDSKPSSKAPDFITNPNNNPSQLPFMNNIQFAPPVNPSPMYIPLTVCKLPFQTPNTGNNALSSNPAQEIPSGTQSLHQNPTPFFVSNTSLPQSSPLQNAINKPSDLKNTLLPMPNLSIEQINKFPVLGIIPPPGIKSNFIGTDSSEQNIPRNQEFNTPSSVKTSDPLPNSLNLKAKLPESKPISLTQSAIIPNQNLDFLPNQLKTPSFTPTSIPLIDKPNNAESPLLKPKSVLPESKPISQIQQTIIKPPFSESQPKTAESPQKLPEPKNPFFIPTNIKPNDPNIPSIKKLKDPAPFLPQPIPTYPPSSLPAPTSFIQSSQQITPPSLLSKPTSFNPQSTPLDPPSLLSSFNPQSTPFPPSLLSSFNPQSTPSDPPSLLSKSILEQTSVSEQSKLKLAPKPIIPEQNILTKPISLPTNQPPPFYQGTLPSQQNILLNQNISQFEYIEEPIMNTSSVIHEQKPHMNVIVTSPLEEEKNLDFCSNQTLSDDNTSVNARDKDLESVNQVIIDVMKCCLCGENKNEKILKCGHILCKECIQDSVEIAASKQIYYSANSKIHPKCPSCSKDIDDMFFIYEDYYKNLKSEHIDKYMQLISRAKKCLGCKSFYPLKGFFDEDLCKHLCKDCLSIEIALSKEKCPYCLCKYELDKIKGYKEKCSCCLKDKKYVEEYMISLCKGHNHCFDCAKAAVKEKTCSKCKSLIGQKDLIRTLKRLKQY